MMLKHVSRPTPVLGDEPHEELTAQRHPKSLDPIRDSSEGGVHEEGV